ncbi:MAG: hypothetical protein HYZ37_04310 [Candidatus Solibacter usitatus]|nr:hypothetical protein [Candidatus Solibacter usitatus]
MKPALLLLFTTFAFAQKADHPTGSRITPPTIRDVAPLGVSRGTTVEMTVEGFNLARATGIVFSEPGIKGRILRIKELPDLPDIRLGSNGTPSTIDLGPLPPRNQVTVELDVEPGVDAGVVKFRLQTPLGTSPEGQFLVEPYFGESLDREPNDTPETAFETFLPTIFAGTISRPGDADHFRFPVKAGEEVVFENSAPQIGSTLQPVVTILAEDGAVLAEFGRDRPESAMAFSYKFAKAGFYYFRVTDFQFTGRSGNFYRYKAGKFPLVTHAYPLGLRRGESKEINFSGPGLAGAGISVKGEASAEDENSVMLRPKTSAGRAYNQVKLSLGDEPETESTGKNLSAASAQSIAAPVTINGRIDNGVANFFRFPAKKGQTLVVDVNARRLDSELDSEIEILDSSGKPIERAVARAESETYVTLRDHDSVRPGIRIQSWSSFAVGDYLLIGSEIVRIASLPRGPDDDFISESFGGQRMAYFGTSPEAHANDQGVYKVRIHPPGAKFASNGLPLTRLYYRNDDGGPLYGKDSFLKFVAPADGEYVLRIRDVRGAGGPGYAYRLSVRGIKPDFRLAMNPRNPNIPLGGSIPVTVTALRIEEFNGPIQVSVDGLPSGLRATAGTIGAGQIATTILLTADAAAKIDQPVPLRVTGRAAIDGRQVARTANPADKLMLASVMPRPDILMTSETREVEIEPGGTAEVFVSVARQGDYGGRVPVQVLNLPPRVRVLDVGLNGVLVTEDESRRSFTLEALPSAEPVEQVIYIAGTVETRSPQQSMYAAPQAIRLKVKPARTVQ